MASKKIIVGIVVAIVVAFLLLVLALSPKTQESKPSRADAIPESAVKMTPQMDLYPPVVHSDEWETPVPMPGPINTAGAEDSAFIAPDGQTFYFFFTPDVKVPPEKQLLDKVTGIWWSHKVGANWSEPERVILSDDLSLDGAEFVQGDTMWFASVRTGNYNEIDVYTAKLVNGEWTGVQNAGSQLNVDYNIGEFHISADDNTLYFHSGNWSAGESMDIWMSNKTATGWGTPYRVPNVNSNMDEGYPFLTADGNELWFTRLSQSGYAGPALWRSVKTGGTWGTPVEMVSNFAGECTMDSVGNIYFTHHFYDQNNSMVEADIYVAYHRATRALFIGVSEAGDRGPIGACLIPAPMVAILLAAVGRDGAKRTGLSRP